MGVTHVDLMVMQRSCSSFRVSVMRVSPALADAMMPAWDRFYYQLRPKITDKA
jgi:hypothetical protein